MTTVITFQAYIVKPGDKVGKLVRGGIETPSDAMSWRKGFNKILDYAEVRDGIYTEIRIHPSGEVVDDRRLEVMQVEMMDRVEAIKRGS